MTHGLPRPRARFRPGTLAVLGAATVASSPALSDPMQVPFRVEWAAGSACSEPERFASTLSKRTDRLRPADPAERALLLRVAVTADAGAFAGRLAVVYPDGSQVIREVPGADCVEVTEAMVLIAAVLVDPTADLSPSSQLEGGPATPRPAESEREPARSSGAAPRPDGAALQTERDAARSRSWHVSFSAGVAFAVEGAPVPDVTPAGALELGFGLVRDAVLSPVLVLSLERAAPTTATTPNGAARFEWSAGRLSACPFRFPAAGRWAARPCTFLELGTLRAEGEATMRPRDAHVPWRATGAALRLEYEALGPLVLAVEADLVIPLHHDTFYFEPATPATTAFVTPRVAPAMRLALAFRAAR